MSTFPFNAPSGDVGGRRKKSAMPFTGIGLVSVSANLLLAASSWAGLSPLGPIAPANGPELSSLETSSSTPAHITDTGASPLSQSGDSHSCPFIENPVQLGEWDQVSSATTSSPVSPTRAGAESPPLLIPLPTAISTGAIGLLVVALLLAAKRTLRRLFA